MGTEGPTDYRLARNSFLDVFGPTSEVFVLRIY
jgi:hypothetical protein